MILILILLFVFFFDFLLDNIFLLIDNIVLFIMLFSNFDCIMILAMINIKPYSKVH